MGCDARLMGHGGIYDELGQVATMLGTGHADQKHCGLRVDAVRDAIERVAADHLATTRSITSALDELAEIKEANLTSRQRACLGAAVSLLAPFSTQEADQGKGAKALDDGVGAPLWQQFRDEIADALTDAYCGGASGRGWTFMGDPIPKDEVKARLMQDPDKTRHIAHMEAAVWAVIEQWTVPPVPESERRSPSGPSVVSESNPEAVTE